MSNVIDFPSSRQRSTAHAGHAHVASALLRDPPPASHTVQFYEHDGFLVETVGTFISAGLRAGESVIVIATPEHSQSFARWLASAAADGPTEGRLTVLDAADTLASFMVDGMPDALLFHSTVASLLRLARGVSSDIRCRAYGEMVDLLTRGGNPAAAVRVEELWTDACKMHSLSLLCAYAMQGFASREQAERFHDVCSNHTHVVPSESFARLDDELTRLREISRLQQRARSLDAEIELRKGVELALRDALREQQRVEQDLRASIERERQARAQAEASDAFKELFLGILGHDLRNPLSTILTTVRLMTIRRELSPESQKRIDRVIASGERMQRMIEQILDVTQLRLASGLPLNKQERVDLAALTAKIVEEARLAHPDRTIAFVAQADCCAHADGARFEQVVSNLIGNAIAHGDPRQTITVLVTPRPDAVELCVHNYGLPIDPAFMPFLFDPFRQAAKPQGRSDGLGLGLYISQRIVSAHGGAIVVSSTQDTGTRFDVTLPR